ncbi:unnamed protein product [Adineta ricciae]|uniref:Uncharacterized protein n=1 Tax=Adineta ricciae TaxID=249248 RepID=A0A814VA55_ADIRI|nr:unnamed protein product [Adineta ricciae]CAF1186243.1 unnamed protein product [Adineta ricciae]
MFISLKLQWIHSQNFQGDYSTRARFTASTQLNDNLTPPFKEMTWAEDDAKQEVVNSIREQKLIGSSGNPRVNSEMHELLGHCIKRCNPKLKEACCSQFHVCGLTYRCLTKSNLNNPGESETSSLLRLFIKAPLAPLAFVSVLCCIYRCCKAHKQPNSIIQSSNHITSRSSNVLQTNFIRAPTSLYTPEPVNQSLSLSISPAVSEQHSSLLPPAYNELLRQESIRTEEPPTPPPTYEVFIKKTIEN